MRRKVRGFFYASPIRARHHDGAKSVMVGGVLGSREARRILDPVCQPDTSSTALRLTAPVGGYKTTVKEAIMPSSNVVPLRAQNPQYAQELIDSIQPKNFTLEELNAIVGDLPRDLQAVISLVSSEFDHFDKSRRSSSFIAMRLLAMIAANISHALENPHV
jgi:hypothetical protein